MRDLRVEAPQVRLARRRARHLSPPNLVVFPQLLCGRARGFKRRHLGLGSHYGSPRPRQGCIPFTFCRAAHPRRLVPAQFRIGGREHVRMLERQMVEVESAQARDALQGADSAGAKELGAWHLRRQQQRPDLTVAQEGLGVSGAPRRLDLGRCQRCFALCRRRRLLLLPCGRPLLKPGHWPQRERGLGRRQRRRRCQSSTQLPPNEAQPNGRLVCVDRAVHQARGPSAWFDR